MPPHKVITNVSWFFNFMRSFWFWFKKSIRTVLVLILVAPIKGIG
jgi:hypothetical protein